jgi:hypothetical protein
VLEENEEDRLARAVNSMLPDDDEARALEVLAPDDDQPDRAVYMIAAHLIRLSEAHPDESQRGISQMATATGMIILMDILVGHKPAKKGIERLTGLLQYLGRLD